MARAVEHLPYRATQREPKLEGEPSLSPADRAAMRDELIALLSAENLPRKAQILRAKLLIRRLARRGDDAGSDELERKLMSAYLDVYLGRMTGERAIVKAGVDQCLRHLQAMDELAARQMSPPGQC